MITISKWTSLIPPLKHSFDNSPMSEQPLLETAYGPWLLVSYRRGRARGRGDASRAYHVPLRPVADSSVIAVESRDLVSRSPCGGRSLASRGRFIGSHTSHRIPISDIPDASPTNPCLVNPAVDSSLEIISPTLRNVALDVAPSPGIEPAPNGSFPSDSSIHLSLSHTALDVGKTKNFIRPSSPPPILRSSLQDPSPLTCTGDQSHVTLVDKVSSALDPGTMEEDDTDGEDLSKDEDEEMSEDGGPDDAMTLIQYQEEARRDPN